MRHRPLFRQGVDVAEIDFDPNAVSPKLRLRTVAWRARPLASTYVDSVGLSEPPIQRSRFEKNSAVSPPSTSQTAAFVANEAMTN
jgi:hypothetical protein